MAQAPPLPQGPIPKQAYLDNDASEFRARVWVAKSADEAPMNVPVKNSVMYSIAVTHNTIGQHEYEGTVSSINHRYLILEGQRNATYFEYAEADELITDATVFFDFEIQVNNQPWVIVRPVSLNKNLVNDREVMFSPPNGGPFRGTDSSRIIATNPDVVHIDLGTVYGLRNNSDGGGHTLYFFIKNFSEDKWEEFGTWDVERETPYTGVFEFESTDGMFVKTPVARLSEYVEHDGTDWKIEMRVRFGTNEEPPVDSFIVLKPWADGGLNGEGM